MGIREADLSQMGKPSADGGGLEGGDEIKRIKMCCVFVLTPHDKCNP